MPQYPIRSKTEETYSGSATLSGAYVDIDLKNSAGASMPAGVVVKNTQFRVDEEITSGDGATSWDGAFVGGASDAICSAQAFAKNTKGYKSTVGIVTDDTTKARITPDTGTFSGGKITVVCQVDQYGNLDDLP